MNVLFFEKTFWRQNFFFCNVDANDDFNDDADAKMPMPRFPNGRSDRVI